MIIENPIQIKIASLLKIVKRIRQEKGLSQYEMSNKLCISQNTYFKIEKGKTKLDFYRLVQISNVLEFNLSEVLYGIGL